MPPSGQWLQQFKQTCDPFFTGCTTAEALATFYVMTGGMFFPLTGGAVVLLRRRLYPTPSAWRVCGMARPATGSIKQYAGFPHEGDQGYQYTAVRTDGNGYISAEAEPVRIDFESNGTLTAIFLPMWPVAVSAEPLASGEFRISWGYSSWGSTVMPTDFAIYEGVDAASVDYDTILGTVAYDPATDRYEYETSEAYGDGTTHVFAVRARNADAKAEQNTYTTPEVVAMAGNPDDAEIQIAHQRRPGRPPTA